MINLKDHWQCMREKKKKNRHNVCQIVLMVNILTVLFQLLWLQPTSVNVKKKKKTYNHLEGTNNQKIVYIL